MKILNWFKPKKKEIDLTQVVRVKMSGNEFTDIENAFQQLGVTSASEKEEILSTYTWHYHDDHNRDFECAMQLIKTEELEAEGPFDDTRDVYEIYHRVDYVRKRPKSIIEEEPDDESETTLRDISEIRARNKTIWQQAGYIPVDYPYSTKEINIRPKEEIAGRLHALKAMIIWAWATPEQVSDEVIHGFIERNHLKDFFAENEQVLFRTKRDDENMRNNIGWKFENSWPLAWYFGYIEPEITGKMMDQDQMLDILHHHTCDLDESINDWLPRVNTISEEELIAKEDMFYCIHNAVRSAQLGRNTVPPGFHPVLNGGVIHERRHSLTWMISKGISLDDTDLST